MLTRRRFVTALAAAAVSCVSSKPAAVSTPESTPVATARPSPTGARVESGRYNVRAFGAVGDGVADDTDAIAQAIRAATQGPPGGIVFFPKGRYLLVRGTRIQAKSPYPAVRGIGDVAGSARALIALQDVRDLSLEGEEGTMLLARDAESAVIGLAGCRNVTVRSLAMDYEPLLFTQGTVVAVDQTGRTLDLRIDAGYPDPTTPRFTDTHLTVRAADSPDVVKSSTGNFGDVYFAQHGDVRPVGAATYRRSGAFPAHLRGVTPGDRFALAPHGVSAVPILFSRDCLFERVTVHSSPGLCYVALGDERLTFRECVIEPLPGSGRLLSTNKDGIHSKWNRVGPTLEGCRFSGMGDDGFNFHGSGVRILSAEGSTLTVERAEFFHAGDELAVIDQGTGLTRGTAKIVDASLVRWRQEVAVRLVLDAKVAGTTSAEAMGLGALPPRHVDTATPPERRPDMVANLAAIGSGFAVRRSVFARYRGGNRVYAWNGVIEDCRFERVNLHAVQLGIELLWPEVYHARHVTIRRNQFIANAGMPNIRIKDFLGDHSPARQGFGNRDIQIAENRFEGYGLAGAIHISNAEDVRLAGNEFAGGTEVPVALDLCRAVSIETARPITISTSPATDMRTLALKGPISVAAGGTQPWLR